LLTFYSGKATVDPEQPSAKGANFVKNEYNYSFVGKRKVSPGQVDTQSSPATKNKANKPLPSGIPLSPAPVFSSYVTNKCV
jgi:hypothetical protein